MWSRAADRTYSAPRTCRPSGRSGRVAILPFARRRPHASFRIGPDCEADGPNGRGGGRDAHALAHNEIDRAGTKARRAPELSVAQTAPGIRRRDESAARGDLFAAIVRPRGRGRAQG